MKSARDGGPIIFANAHPLTLVCVFIFEQRVCVNVYNMISAQKKTGETEKETEKYRVRSVTEETEMSDGRAVEKNREAECRSGLRRLLCIGGLGSTANYV